MDADDLQPAPKPATPKNLDEMSVAALRDYIADLEAEIERARRAIEMKQQARTGADKLFKL